MRKLLAILLMTGIFLGMMAVVGELCEESSFSSLDPLYDIVEEEGDNPTPCGGEGGGGGGLPG